MEIGRLKQWDWKRSRPKCADEHRRSLITFWLNSTNLDVTVTVKLPGNSAQSSTRVLHVRSGAKKLHKQRYRPVSVTLDCQTIPSSWRNSRQAESYIRFSLSDNLHVMCLHQPWRSKKRGNTLRNAQNLNITMKTKRYWKHKLHLEIKSFYENCVVSCVVQKPACTLSTSAVEPQQETFTWQSLLFADTELRMKSVCVDRNLRYQ